MKDRLELEREEQVYLKKQEMEHPELFPAQTLLDNEAVLRRVGIELPNKDHYPLGFLKLYPEDFIVEEISAQNEVITIDYKNTIDKGFLVDPKDETIFATLVKRNVSTLEAVDDMRKILGCTEDQIQYAGIKDRDALTSQRLTLHGIAPEKLKTVSSPHFFLKDITSGKGIIKKGYLKGNKFTILIRTEKDFIDSPQFKILTTNLQKVNKDGFYNFYYLQRFGQEYATSRINSVDWALPLFTGDYKKAIFNFLALPDPREKPFFQQFRSMLGTHFGDWNKLRELLSPLAVTLSGELKVVEYLCDHPEDYVGSLQQIPEQFTLWLYSVTSYLFNRKLSKASLSNAPLPHELPLAFSNSQKDLDVYKEEFAELGISPDGFQYFKPFPFIELKHRTAPTKEHPVFHGIEIVPEGIVVSFSLNKGCYATTFLAHLFNLVWGTPPKTMSTAPTTLHENLRAELRKKTLEFFKTK